MNDENGCEFNQKAIETYRQAKATATGSRDQLKVPSSCRWSHSMSAKAMCRATELTRCTNRCIGRDQQRRQRLHRTIFSEFLLRRPKSIGNWASLASAFRLTTYLFDPVPNAMNSSSNSCPSCVGKCRSCDHRLLKRMSWWQWWCVAKMTSSWCS